jgi:hypothetical protein
MPPAIVSGEGDARLLPAKPATALGGCENLRPQAPAAHRQARCFPILLEARRELEDFDGAVTPSPMVLEFVKRILGVGAVGGMLGRHVREPIQSAHVT